tara:strand:- start:235 stop:753 length:519 start_codon:yes stop_codon:yes gene_type:complete
MPQVDDDYRKKAAMTRLKKVSRDLPVDPSGMVGGVAKIGAKIATPLIGRIANPTMQRALDVAEAEGRQVNAGLLSDNAAQGVRFSQDSIVRGGKAAQEELFNFLDRMQGMGVKPATANKFLRGFSRYVDDPVEGIAELGGNVGRTRPGSSAKERLVKRLLKSMGDAAEDSFF